VMLPDRTAAAKLRRSVIFRSSCIEKRYETHVKIAVPDTRALTYGQWHARTR
jgi:hypothetical protein